MDTQLTELRQTTVAGNGHIKIDGAKPRFDPTRIFVQRDRLVWFWFGFAMLVLVAAAMDRFFLVQSFKQRERIVVIDPANTFYVSPLLKFEDAKALHVQQSTLAATAFLERNPKGFDNDELLKQIKQLASAGEFEILLAQRPLDVEHGHLPGRHAGGIEP